MPIYKVVLSGTQYAQLWQNRLWFDVAADAEPLAVADTFDTHWVDTIRQTYTFNHKFVNINVTKMTGGAPLSASKPISKTGAQGESNQQITFAVWVLKFITGLGGRKFRGRMYGPSVMAGHYNQGAVDGSGIAFWAATLASLNTKFTGGSPTSGMNLIIRGEGGEPHDTHVTAIALRGVIGVQRRRNIGVGA